MEDQVEAGVGEGRQVGHVAFNGADVEPIPLGHLAITGKLARRVVVDRHLRAGRGQDRPLLPPPEARQSTSAPGNGGNHARGTGMEGVSPIDHSPRRAGSTAPLLTGIVHGSPAATWRFEASRL